MLNMLPAATSRVAVGEHLKTQLLCMESLDSSRDSGAPSSAMPPGNPISWRVPSMSSSTTPRGAAEEPVEKALRLRPMKTPHDIPGFEHLPVELRHDVLASPWASWVEKQIRADVEREIRKELTDRFAEICAERIKVEAEVIEQKLQQEKIEAIANVEEMWRETLQRTSSTWEKSVEDMKRQHHEFVYGSNEGQKGLMTRNHELEAVHAQTLEEHAKEREELMEKHERMEQEYQEEVALRDKEIHRLRRDIDAISKELNLVGSKAWEELELTWEELSAQWGDQFREISAEARRRLKPLTKEWQIEGVKSELKRRLRTTREELDFGGPDLRMQAQEFGGAPLPSEEGGGPDEHHGEGGRASGRLERFQKLWEGLVANNVLLERVHRRRLAQRSSRSAQQAWFEKRGYRRFAALEDSCAVDVANNGEARELGLRHVSGIRDI